MGVEDGRIRSVTTTRGTIEAEYVVIACRRLGADDRGDGRRVHPAHARSSTR